MIVPTLWTVITLASLISSGAASRAGHSTKSGNKFNGLQPLLSPAAEIYHPGSEGYTNLTNRWSAEITPGLDLVVKVASEEDVKSTVSSVTSLYEVCC